MPIPKEGILRNSVTKGDGQESTQVSQLMFVADETDGNRSQHDGFKC